MHVTSLQSTYSGLLSLLEFLNTIIVKSCNRTKEIVLVKCMILICRCWNSHFSFSLQYWMTHHQTALIYGTYWFTLVILFSEITPDTRIEQMWCLKTFLLCKQYSRKSKFSEVTVSTYVQKLW